MNGFFIVRDHESPPLFSAVIMAESLVSYRQYSLSYGVSSQFKNLSTLFGPPDAIFFNFFWLLTNPNSLTCLLVPQVTTRARHIAHNKKATGFEGYEN